MFVLLARRTISDSGRRARALTITSFGPRYLCKFYCFHYAFIFFNDKVTRRWWCPKKARCRCRRRLSWILWLSECHAGFAFVPLAFCFAFVPTILFLLRLSAESPLELILAIMWFHFFVFILPLYVNGTGICFRFVFVPYANNKLQTLYTKQMLVRVGAVLGWVGAQRHIPRFSRRITHYYFNSNRYKYLHEHYCH